MKRVHRWFWTPLAVVLLFIALFFWTWVVLGWGAAWRFGAILLALGATDLAIGWGPGLTLSEEVNRRWHANPGRYILWIVGVLIGLLMLHLHFTGG